MGRLAVIAMTAYMAVVMYLMIVAGVWPTLDLVAIAVALVAILLGRARLFFRDWLPFVLIFLGWEAMRGLADNLGAPVASDSVIALERAMFGGIVPTVELQRLLYRPEAVGWLDVLTSLVYSAHFMFPLGIAFIFWTRDRSLYYRFAATLLVMALAAFIVYVFVPVAPPRFAHRHGEALPVTDIIGATILKLDLPISADWVYQNLSPNDNAAFPSLHAAFPLLAFLFVRRQHPRGAWIIAAWTALVWFAITYTGHHYVVDIVGGAAFAVAAYLGVDRTGLLNRALAWLMVAGLPPRLGRAAEAHAAAAPRSGQGRTGGTTPRDSATEAADRRPT
ncbi:MAG TPA: phosphatase PAP2 family protein [Candidatus Limnocylindria bacterium]|nr:phosphatase PAP2 family protein [Candidatus Limnocylindria bacterium]